MSKKLNDFSISNTVERKKYNDFYNDFIYNQNNDEMQINSFLDFVRHYDILEDDYIFDTTDSYTFNKSEEMDYMAFTEEPWLNRSGINPNEGWFSREIDKAVAYVGTELNGTLTKK